jgi:hypothetical protein
MDAFVLFTVTFPKDVRNILVDWLIRSHKRRDFIEAFHSFLSSATSRDLGAFQLLKMIVETEPLGLLNDITLVRMISGLLIWIALLVDYVNPPASGVVRAIVSTFLPSKEQLVISEFFTLLFGQPGLVMKERLNLDVSSISLVSSGIATISRQVALLDLAQISSIVTCVAEVGNATPAFLMIRAQFFGYLAEGIARFSSPQAITLKATLNTLIAWLFGVRSRLHQLALASSLCDVLDWDFPVGELANIYFSLVDVLRSPHVGNEAALERKAFDLLVRVIPRIPKAQIDALSLFAALENVFEHFPFDASFFTPLEIYAEIRPDLMVLATSAKLNLNGFLALIGTDEKRIIAILRKLTSDRLLAVLAQLTPGDRGRCGIILLRNAQMPYSAQILYLVSGLAVTLKSSEDPSAIEFKGRLLPILIDGADPTRIDSSECCVEALRILIS